MAKVNSGLTKALILIFVKSGIFALLLAYFLGGQDKLTFGIYTFLLFAIAFLPHDLYKVKMAKRERLRLAGFILLALLALAYIFLGQSREFSVIIILALSSSLVLLFKKIRADKKS